MKPFTYRGHEFYLSSTTTTVRRWGREVIRWIIACDGEYGWRAGFHDRPTTVAEAKEHLRIKIEHAAASRHDEDLAEAIMVADEMEPEQIDAIASHLANGRIDEARAAVAAITP